MVRVGEMKNEIDFTKMKPNKKLRLIKCPNCGRVGQLHKYTDGQASISHKGNIELGFFNIKDRCFFREWIISNTP